MTTGAELIAAERERQITEEGYTPEHDRGNACDLVHAAEAYVSAYKRCEANLPPAHHLPASWPWGAAYWKPTGDKVRDLVKAGALIVAAIDSIQGEPADG